jgi:glyoxylase-like metal-dependent hydrolase (beta-lactamase superfamily II)
MRARITLLFALFVIGWLWLDARAQTNTPIVSGAHRFEKVADGIYYATASGTMNVGANSPVILTDTEALIVDSSITPAAARAMVQDIKAITDKPIRYVVDSHYHYDHSFGNQIYPPDVQVIGHANTRMRMLGPVMEQYTYLTSVRPVPERVASLKQRIAQEKDPQQKATLERQVASSLAYLEQVKEIKVTPPNLTFADSMALFRGGREIHITYLGRGHTDTDVVVFLPKERIAATGDLMESVISYGGDSYPEDWIATLERLKALDFDTVMPGHGVVFKGKARITAFQQYLRDAIDQVNAARKKGLSPEEAAKGVDVTKYSAEFPQIRGLGVDPAFARRIYAVAQDPHAGPTPDLERSNRLGKVHFENSCSPAVAREFDRAMALLHSFEFAEAIAGFQNVLKEDATCGMAEWGIAMSTWGNPFAGQRPPATLKNGLAAAERARGLGAKTDRERAYIDAVILLYKDAARLDQRARTLAYEQAMERIYKTYPNDLEAAAFYALAVDQTAPPTDKTYANQLKAAAILERLFKMEPDHPGVTHYLIHSYDVPPLAPRGLVYARRYADLAPDAPHALHMPAHTFTRVGAWQESIDTNIRSHDAALAHGNPGEGLHALDYMTYAYLQTAQDEAAKKSVDELERLLAQPSAGGGVAGGFPSAAIPARYALERGAWADAATLTARPSNLPYVEAMTHFARALGAARSGNPAAAQAASDRLAALRDQEIAAKDEYWTTQVDIQRQAAEAWVLWAQGKKDAALKAMTAAAQLEDTTEKAAVTPGPLAPARELLGEMLLEAARPADALTAFEANLKKEPNRFRSLYGAAHAAELAGNRQKSRTYYAQLVKICDRGDRPGRPELQHARESSR